MVRGRGRVGRGMAGSAVVTKQIVSFVVGGGFINEAK